jgi:ATP-binding cassette subfamily B protein
MKEKAKYNLFSNSAWMIGLAVRHQRSVLYLAVAVAVLGVLTSLLGLFVAPTVLGAVEEGVPAGQLALLIFLFTAGLMVLYALASYADANTIFGQFAVRLKINAAIQKKALMTAFPNLGDQAFRKKHQASLFAVSANARAAEGVWGTLTDLLKNIIGFAIYLLLLASLNPYIVLLVLATSLGSFFVSNHLNLWSHRRRDEEDDYANRLNYNRQAARHQKLAKDIRLFGMKEWIDDMYASTLKLYEAFTVHREKVLIWSGITDIVLTFARNGVAYFVLIGLVLNDVISAAQFLLYFSAVGGFTAWVGGILTGFSKLHMQSLELSIIREFLEFPEVFAFEEGEPLTPDVKKPYALELKDVTFRYPKAEDDTLRNISLKITPGEKLAVVGLNGAGKTTLVKLLCGLMDPTAGAVLLNGEDIRRYDRRDVYRHFAAIFQYFSVLEATVAENIAQALEGFDRDKVAACAKLAGIAEKIESLPDKYDTRVGRYIYPDGMEFSGGEYQRLMLARALYKDAPILVLDEPTAALDPIAESIMYEKYNELTAGRTAIYISHRLASTRFCDRIILIGQNQIAEEGTHEELIAKGGTYAELFAIQSKYYQEGALEDEI